MRVSSKAIIFLFSLGWLLNSFATTKGPYLGAQVGWGYVHQGTFISYHLNRLIQKNYKYISLSPMDILQRDTGLAERVFAGYQVNNYFALEMGYYHFAPIQVNTRLNGNITVLERFGIDIPIKISSKTSVSTYAVDLVAKGILPVTQCFSVYGKLGLAYLNSNGSAKVSASFPLGEVKLSTTPSVNLVYPAFGVGMNYDLSKNASVDFSWNHIQKIHPCPYPNIDFISAGVIYHFG